jgi:hypothetical protein
MQITFVFFAQAAPSGMDKVKPPELARKMVATVAPSVTMNRNSMTLRDKD